MSEEKTDKTNRSSLSKNYKEFYPKNYSKKNPTSKTKYPLEKDSASFYPKSHFKQVAKKYPENNEDYSDEDEYSGLAYKNNNNQNKKIQTKKAKKYYRYSEDYNDYYYQNNDYKAKWKTEMCHYWEMYGTCKFGDTCAFAHGPEELNKRKMSLNYKTKPCKQFFELGYCSYGIRCQFSHKLLKETKEENKVSYLKILKEFNNSDETISHEIIKRPRLMTFEDICKSGNDIKEKNRIKLYEDINEIKKKAKDEHERAFSEETNDDENNKIKQQVNNNDNNNLIIDDNNQVNDNKKRGRFISI